MDDIWLEQYRRNLQRTRKRMFRRPSFKGTAVDFNVMGQALLRKGPAFRLMASVSFQAASNSALKAGDSAQYVRLRSQSSRLLFSMVDDLSAFDQAIWLMQSSASHLLSVKNEPLHAAALFADLAQESERRSDWDRAAYFHHESYLLFNKEACSAAARAARRRHVDCLRRGLHHYEKLQPSGAQGYPQKI